MPKGKGLLVRVTATFAVLAESSGDLVRELSGLHGYVGAEIGTLRKSDKEAIAIRDRIASEALRGAPMVD